MRPQDKAKNMAEDVGGPNIKKPDMGYAPSGFFIALFAMAGLVAASNFLVQYPINDWLTWGAFTFPVCFLVTDLCNRSYGAQAARRVVYVGFLIGLPLSFFLAGPRIAVASGTAFLVGQLLDVYLFDKLRRAQGWWRAPFFSSFLASLIDTGLFFSLAFAGSDLPWVTLGIGDFGIKLAMALVLLAPYRLLMNRHTPPVKLSAG